ncbi:helix-turn-helix domain-containing protein [Haloferax marisrubri]|uniref:Transcriptional regulator n=1 Tax=Haloferax marisrubri TaxID=1544719 RepID=A0A2P4NMD3_9EURY|nr:helix-turn-helix domain-containing protein [Haloferax marisrubri]POG54284.1 transcriptional regulator [Haloferax marisrubri]
MREYVFTIHYEEGADDLMDLFIEWPSLHAIAISHASDETMWRLDYVTGKPEALDAFEALIADIAHCDAVIGDQLVVDREYEVILRDPQECVVYTRRPERDDARSVTSIINEYLGDGHLCQTDRRGNEYEWRILVDDERAVSDIYDRLHAGVRDGVSVELTKISDPTYWTNNVVRSGSLPPEQREAIEAAVELGYYEKPRQASAVNVADELGISQSTYQYRLNAAESWLAKQFVEHL